MKIECAVYKAEALDDRAIPDVEISIISGIDKVPYPRQPVIFIEDASSIYQVLSKHLPQGTLDQLLIMLLQGKASRLVVPFTG